MKIKKIEVILFFIIVMLFMVIEEYFSIVMWCAFYFIGYKISKLLFKEIKSKNHFIILYYLFSIIGLIICTDNFFNFNVLVGYAGDDATYLQGTKYLVGQAGKPAGDISFFSYFLAIIAYPISIFKEVSLSELISLNWMCAALIGTLLNKLSVILIKKNIPLLLLILAFPLHFLVTDNLSRLYRDNLILLFSVIGTIGIFINKKGYTFISMIPVGLLRLANLSYFVIIFILNKIRFKRFKYTVVTVATAGLLLTNFLYPIARYALRYGTEITRIEVSNAYSMIDAKQILSTRWKNQSDANSIKSQAFSTLSIKSLFIRASFPYLFPLTPNWPASKMKFETWQVKGFYFYYLINWINLMSVIIVTPFLIIGILICRTEKLNILIGTYFIFLLLVLIFSGQSRHALGSFVYNTIFVANGYYYVKNNKLYKTLTLLSILGLALFVLIYNIFNR